MISIVKLRYSNTASGNSGAICYGGYSNFPTHIVHYMTLPSGHTRNFSFSVDFYIQVLVGYDRKSKNSYD